MCLVFCVGEQNLLGFGWDFGSIFIVLVFFQFLVLIAKVLNYLNTLVILMRKFKNICTILEFNVFVYVV